jgi:UDP-glucose 4-epimerase
MESDLPVEHAPRRTVNAVPRRLADVSGARERLGFTAEVGLDDGLGRLVGWWRSVRRTQPARA